MKSQITFFIFLMSLACTSLAGSFHVSPIRVELSGKEKSKILKVENNGDSAVTIQIKVMSWLQQDGKDMMLNTRDVIATPPIFFLKAGATQLVRVGMLRKPEQSLDLSYRLFLEEIPSPPAPDFKGLQVALRIGIPIFIKPDLEARQQLNFSVIQKKDGMMQLSVSNSGTAHSQISNLKIYSASKPDQLLSSLDTSMYLLPGQERTLQLDSDDLLKTFVGPLIIKAQTRAGPVESHATLNTQN